MSIFSLTENGGNSNIKHFFSQEGCKMFSSLFHPYLTIHQRQKSCYEQNNPPVFFGHVCTSYGLPTSPTTQPERVDDIFGVISAASHRMRYTAVTCAIKNNTDVHYWVQVLHYVRNNFKNPKTVELSFICSRLCRLYKTQAIEPLSPLRSIPWLFTFTYLLRISGGFGENGRLIDWKRCEWTQH